MPTRYSSRFVMTSRFYSPFSDDEDEQLPVLPDFPRPRKVTVTPKYYTGRPAIVPIFRDDNFPLDDENRIRTLVILPNFGDDSTFDTEYLDFLRPQFSIPVYNYFIKHNKFDISHQLAELRCVFSRLSNFLFDREREGNPITRIVFYGEKPDFPEVRPYFKISKFGETIHNANYLELRERITNTIYACGVYVDIDENHKSPKKVSFGVLEVLSGD